MDNLIIGNRFKDALTLKNICIRTSGRYLRENPVHIQIRKRDVV